LGLNAVSHQTTLALNSISSQSMGGTGKTMRQFKVESCSRGFLQQIRIPEDDKSVTLPTNLSESQQYISR
jgi:hypothetical protein